MRVCMCIRVWVCSDDRTAEVFRTTIEAATQMKAVIGEQPRPNCLIIDEIDGAPQVGTGRHGCAVQVQVDTGM